MLWDENGNEVDVEQLRKYDKIVFYGATSRNQIAIKDLEIEDKVLYYVDGNPEMCGNSMDGYEIHEVDEIAQTENVLVLSVLANFVSEISAKMQKYHVKCLFYVIKVYDITKTVEQNEKIIEAGNRYKYIHVFPALVFMRFFYEMIEESDDITQHLFFINWYRQEDLFKMYPFICGKNIKNNNILILSDLYEFVDPYIDGKNINEVFFSNKMEEIFEAADKIILHSAYMKVAGRKLFGEIADKMGEKMCWTCFGTDGYYEEDNPIVNEVIRKVKMPYAAPARIPDIQQNYKIPIKEMNATYSYISKSVLKNDIEKSNEDNCIKILLGHSAVDYGNHIYGLKLLEKYRNENIKIYCPLSYTHTGGVYSKGVIEKGKEIFGDKFIPILEYIEPNDYYAFLRTINVAILPLTRLAAGTTLTYLSAIGKKIYMSKELCEKFALSDIQAEDMEHIKVQSFEEFIDCSNIKEKESRILEMNDKIFFEWKKILEG